MFFDLRITFFPNLISKIVIIKIQRIHLHWLSKLEMNICDSGISLNELEDIIKDIEMFSTKSKIPARIGMHKIKILRSLSFNNIEINKST